MFLMKLSLIKTNCLLPVEHIVSSDLDVEDSNDLVEGLCSYINIEVIKTRGGGGGAWISISRPKTSEGHATISAQSNV